MPRPAKLPIAETDWQQTSPVVQAVVLDLWSEAEQLRIHTQQLQAEVARLREQVGHISRNSSRPPSSDPPRVEKPKRPPSGRPQGQGEFFRRIPACLDLSIEKGPF